MNERAYIYVRKTRIVTVRNWRGFSSFSQDVFSRLRLEWKTRTVPRWADGDGLSWISAKSRSRRRTRPVQLNSIHDTEKRERKKEKKKLVFHHHHHHHPYLVTSIQRPLAYSRFFLNFPRKIFGIHPSSSPTRISIPLEITWAAG